MSQNRRSFIQNSALTLGGLPFIPLLDAFDGSPVKKGGMVVYATNWGFKDGTAAFCKKAKEAGYDGIELWCPRDQKGRDELAAAVAENELKLGLLCGNWGSTHKEQLGVFKTMIDDAVGMKPSFINCHSGKDFYTIDENVPFLEYAMDAAAKSGVRISHETHRGRILYNAPIAEYFIDRYPELLITLDISHWCCVHESLLEDQKERIDKVLERSVHIHSRVGFQEAPQIPFPDDQQYEKAVKAHFDWWDRVVKMKTESGETMTMTTEFGPAGYMWTQPYTAVPVADNWDVNIMMKKMWEERYLG